MSRRPRMSYPQPLPGLVTDSLRTLGLADRLREAEIWRVWPEVVGETLVKRAQPLRIINGALTVSVSSAPWMQELRFMTGIMKDKINQVLGGEVVREIVLKTGKVTPFVLAQDEEPEITRTLTAEQLDLIMKLSDEIADPETREAYVELMRASMEHSR